MFKRDLEEGIGGYYLIIFLTNLEDSLLRKDLEEVEYCHLHVSDHLGVQVLRDHLQIPKEA